MKKHHGIDLPTLTFGVLMLCVVILFVLVKTAPGSQKLGTTAIGVGDVLACDRVCTDWGPACNEQCCGKSCCIKWKWIGQDCGGGGSDQPPTITGTVTCAQSGSNGWCINGAQLQLSASDPQGYTVTITGDINGTPFTCGSSCIENLSAGTGLANYIATSATSNLTDSGSSAWKYDPTPPSVSTSISGTSGSNDWYTSAVTVSATATDSISGVASVSSSVDGGSWVAGSSALVSTNGDHTVEFRATDDAGNTTAKSVTVKVDTSAPSLSLSPSGTRGSNGWYISDVTVTASASDSVSGIASTQYSVAGGTWTTGTSAAVSSDGNHTVEFKTTNNAGLVTTALQSFEIDETKPVIAFNPTGTTGSNNWYTSSVNLGISATDATSGLQSSSYSVDGGASINNANGVAVPLLDGKHTISVNAVDNAGNSASSAVSINVDTTPPTQSLTLQGTSGQNGWYISDVTVTASASDSVSGIASTQYSVDGETWTSGTSVAVSSDGSHTVQFKTTNNAGLSTTASQSLKIDQTKPVIAFNPTGIMGSNNWYTSSVSLGISAEDAISGLQSSSYSVDGGAAIAITNSTASVPLLDGKHTISVNAVDNAGNTANLSASINVDTTPPTQLLALQGTSGQNGWYVSNVQASVQATDVTSGVASSTISDNGGAAQTGTVMLSEGIHHLQFITTDNAGNSVTASQTVQVDTTPPSVSLSMNGTKGSNNWLVSNAQVSFAGNDSTSGLALLEYNVDGAGWQTYSAPITITDGVHTVQGRATDYAGNQSQTSTQISVDTVRPTQSLTLQGTSGKNDWYVSDVQASIQATDATSGVASSTISDNGGTPQTGTVTLTDGVHRLQFVTTDNAGNSVTASQTVQVDTTAPTSKITVPAANSVQIGSFQVKGSSSDATSGLSAVQISWDGTNWTDLSPASGSWFDSLDPSAMPNGSATLYVRAVDQAGNVETPTQLPLTLDNHSPSISLTNSWSIWGNGAVTISPNVFAVSAVQIFVEDPSNRWPDQPIPLYSDISTFPTTSDVQAKILWDRDFGQVEAPPGDYTVLVTACDVNSVCNKAYGKVNIPEPIFNIFPIGPTATAIPTMTPTPTITPNQKNPRPVPTRSEIYIIPVSDPSPAPNQTVVRLTESLASKSVQVGGWLIGLLLAFAITGIFDPRPHALGKLASLIRQAHKDKNA